MILTCFRNGVSAGVISLDDLVIKPFSRIAFRICYTIVICKIQRNIFVKIINDGRIILKSLERYASVTVVFRIIIRVISGNTVTECKIAFGIINSINYGIDKFG